jgi:hypothetical protein
MAAHDLFEISNPPYTMGQFVKIIEDGDGGEVYRVVGVTFDYRMVPGHGWNFWLATDDDITNGYGGADGFTPDDIEAA